MLSLLSKSLYTLHVHAVIPDYLAISYVYVNFSRTIDLLS